MGGEGVTRRDLSGVRGMVNIALASERNSWKEFLEGSGNNM